jgi:integrase/recombinase XerD
MKIARDVPKVLVKSRHRSGCAFRKRHDYIECDCPKQLQWSKKGKLFREQAGTTDKAVALAMARSKQDKWQAKVDGAPVKVEVEHKPTIAEVAEHFLKSKRDDNCADGTIERLRRWIRDEFVGFCELKGLVYLSDVKLIHLDAFRSTWTGQASTRRKRQGRLVGFFSWAMKYEYIEKNAALGLARIKVNDVKPTLALSDKQFARLLASIPRVNGETTDRQRNQLRALILLQRWSGLAIQDATTLERSRLTPDKGGWYRLVLRRAKTGVEVTCMLAPEIGAALIKNAANSRYFFWDGKESKQLLKQRWLRLMDKLDSVAKLKDDHGDPLRFHSHMLRDSFAVWCLNADLSIEDVAALLGHKNIMVTQQHYLPWMKSRQVRLAARVRAAYETHAK